jgi:hypothetical protein
VTINPLSCRFEKVAGVNRGPQFVTQLPVQVLIEEVVLEDADDLRDPFLTVSVYGEGRHLTRFLHMWCTETDVRRAMYKDRLIVLAMRKSRRDASRNSLNWFEGSILLLKSTFSLLSAF